MREAERISQDQSLSPLLATWGENITLNLQIRMIQLEYEHGIKSCNTSKTIFLLLNHQLGKRK